MTQTVRGWLALLVVAACIGCSSGNDGRATPSTTTTTPTTATTPSPTSPTTATAGDGFDLIQDASDALVSGILGTVPMLAAGRSTVDPPTCRSPAPSGPTSSGIVGDSEGRLTGCVEDVAGVRTLRLRNNRATAVLVTFPSDWTPNARRGLSRRLGRFVDAIEAGNDTTPPGRVLGAGEALDLRLDGPSPAGSAVATVPDSLWAYATVVMLLRHLNAALNQLDDVGSVSSALLTAPGNGAATTAGLTSCVAHDNGRVPSTWEDRTFELWPQWDQEVHLLPVAFRCAAGALAAWVRQHVPDAIPKLATFDRIIVRAARDLADQIKGGRANSWVDPPESVELDLVPGAITPPTHPASGPPTWDDIRNAAIPTVCTGPPTILVNGRDLAVPVGEGGLDLQRALYSGRSGMVLGVPSNGAGPLTVIAATCNGGGVSFPTTLLFFSAGGRYYGSTDLNETDWTRHGLLGPARGGVDRMTIVGDHLHIHLWINKATDYGCCPTAKGSVDVTARDHRLLLGPVTLDR